MDPENVPINPGGGGDDLATPEPHGELPGGGFLACLLFSAVTFSATGAVAVCFHPSLRVHPVWGSIVVAIGILDLAAACFWWWVFSVLNFCGP